MYKSRQQGFSLVEILISAAVLVTVLVGLAMLLSYVIRSDTQASNRVVASDLAQEGADFFRRERSFLGYIRLKDHIQYSRVICLNQLNYSESLADPFKIVGGDCGFNIEPTRVSANFKRTAKIDLSIEEEKIDIVVQVFWINGQNDQDDYSSVSSRLTLRPR